MTRRLAMWSGPRNISTAMMRAFENRPDCAVTDEPLYAHYLATTGIDHPGRAEVLSAQSQDWREVCATLVGPAPGGVKLWYQKHMTHHLLPNIERRWMKSLDHCFLIRSPAAVLSSYIKTRPEVTVDDLGFGQQAEIYDWLSRELGSPPLVLESSDVLRAPRGALQSLTDALDLPFLETMLTWPAGPRESDGVWAPHWYHAVESSTGFRPYEARQPEYPAEFQPIVDAATPHYRRLWEARLRVCV
jgi:hypothetical protein